MILIIIKISIVIFFLYEIFIIVKIGLFYIKHKKSTNIIGNNNKNKKIVIAIPCLREQKYIEDTVSYFSKISKDIPIVLITTQKEIKEYHEARSL